MEEALRAHMLAIPALVVVDRRIDWGVRHTGTLPAITLWTISTIPGLTMAGTSSWTRSRVQADCRGRNSLSARGVSDAIIAPSSRGGLHGWRGSAGGILFRTFVLDKSSGDERDGTDVVHVARVDLNIWWQPAGA